MKFRDVRSETNKMIEMACLLLSLSAIFFQIWVLATGIEAHWSGHEHRLLASVILSGIAFAVCALTAWTTGLDHLKGTEEGRTQTYFKNTQFKNDKT